MSRKRYPTDLTDAQWAHLGPLLERPRSHGGRPRTYALREVVNALLYVLRGGVSWRALPHDFPPWESVYDHFRRWKKDRTLERVHEVLRLEVRQKAAHAETPSVLIVDSQSVATTEKGGREALTRARRSKAESGI
jgi:transposase